MSNNFWYQFSPPGHQVTTKLWVQLDLTFRDASFGTLESQIRHTRLELLTVDQNIAKEMDN